MALFRIAAAVGVLLVLAPEQTRTAIGTILSGAEETRKALPTREQAADQAISYCRRNPEICAAVAQKAMNLDKKPAP